MVSAACTVHDFPLSIRLPFVSFKLTKKPCWYCTEWWLWILNFIFTDKRSLSNWSWEPVSQYEILFSWLSCLLIKEGSLMIKRKVNSVRQTNMPDNMRNNMVIVLTLEWLAFTLGLGDGELEFVDEGVLTLSTKNSSPSVGDDASAGASAETSVWIYIRYKWIHVYAWIHIRYTWIHITFAWIHRYTLVFMNDGIHIVRYTCAVAVWVFNYWLLGEKGYDNF